MKAYVLDTGVAMAWYLPETFAAEARRWQRRLLDGEVELIVPGLHYWEAANVLRMLVARAEIEPGLASDIFEPHLEAPLKVREPDRAEVLATALRFSATAYDAVYISLALGSDIPLLTAERTTTPWVTKLGKRIEPIR